ncbi:failed axon connections homolog [Penaeus japonicus]|uniref:failed axon connections homolog n=1 Tax=Penaeus japonicus TaxID=27405 RepID=UPI001C71612C|nr:failed axon connections homolog [Penaeus japonicus]
MLEAVLKGCSWWRENGRAATATVVLLAVGAVSVKRYVARKNRRKRWAAVGKDLVIVHGLHKGRRTPNLSPFVLTLETYLRLAKIPYQMDYEEPFGPKGQSPWITLNGKEMGDSQLIIEMLGRRFGNDFTAKLTPEQQGAARAFHMMVTEHLAWGFRMWRWVENRGQAMLQEMPRIPLIVQLLMPLKRRKIFKSIYIQGIGRHSPEEIHGIIERDLAAISLYLGDKAFLMGSDPCEVDCALFGSLAQIMWNYPGSPYETMVKEKYPNLKEYVLRVKERLWPDWDQCLRSPK